MRKLKWGLFLLLLFVNSALAQSRIPTSCEYPYSLCTEREENVSFDPDYLGRYIGHDEPAVLFYSDVPGSGNYNRYHLVLPRDPKVFPTPTNPAGTGGPTVWNFQLSPAFWFGMALCDTESYPLATHECTPNTDDNIFDDPDPASPRYIGLHPGTAFLELQFFSPGWVFPGASPDKYVGLLHINNLNRKALGPSGPILNNNACLQLVGVEPTTYAFLTLDGKSQGPADALNNDPNKFAVIPGKTFLMNPGDELIVTIRDTPEGLRTVVHDLTTGQTGRMTASIANGFTQVVFDPTATTCTSRPYAYHPMYATSSPHTRVIWGAHSYNIAFSGEIGHFNYCSVQDDSIFPGIGACLVSPVETEVVATQHEPDDFGCVDAVSSVLYGFPGQSLGGCFSSDNDFDGIPYHHAWPGSGTDPYRFSAVPSAVRFTSPKFRPSDEQGEDDERSDNGLRNFTSTAFEADLPAIESSCDRSTGAGCVNPPPGSLFYPIFTTSRRDDGCWWQLGGPFIPGTTNTFGGTSVTEFNTLATSVYPGGTSSHPGIRIRYENFYRALANDPCAGEDQ